MSLLCNSSVHIFYDNVREKQQWTLERIDSNSIGHFKNNELFLACLECNLKRRCIDTKHVLNTPQKVLVILKKN